MADALSRFSIIENQQTIQDPTYKKEMISEIKDIKELTEGILTISLELIYKYQQKYPILISKYKYIYTKRILFVEELI